MFDPDVTPAEKWAVYTTHPVLHKVIGNLSSVVNDSLGYNDMLELIDHKHNINITTINHINTIAQKKTLSAMKVFQRASTVKLLQGWAPTFASLCCQG